MGCTRPAYSSERQTPFTQVAQQALLQMLQVRHMQLMTLRRCAGVAKQIADLGATSLCNVLVHGGVVRRSGADHALYLLMQILCGCGLAAALQQLVEFGAQGGDFGRVLGQATIATVVQYGERVDRAVQRQLAPQAREDIRAPLVSDARALQLVQPGWWLGIAGSPSQLWPLPANTT